jgi:DNA-binding MarR family transcriptional regulator
MTKFAQIPTEAVCRFGELSKTEIRVISFLYAAKNIKTGQCNPGRKAISEMTGLPKSHVSASIKLLEEKGWLIEDEKGHFTLLNLSNKVTESVTPRGHDDDEIPTPESYEIGNSEVMESVTDEENPVTESVTKVTENVTKVTESVTPLIRSSFEHRKNIERTYKEGEPTASDFGEQQNRPLKKSLFWHPAIQIVKKISGHAPPPEIYDAIIEILGVDFDETRLKKCFTAWRIKGCRASNFDWVADWYVNGIPSERKNGTNNTGTTERSRQAQRSRDAEQRENELYAIGLAKRAKASEAGRGLLGGGDADRSPDP